AAADAARPRVEVHGCRTSEVRSHVEAVFGHFATRTAAEEIVRRLEENGFKNIEVENDGCGDFEVELDGVASPDRTPFALEAKRAGYEVSFEQGELPNAYHAGYVNAVFGTRPTIVA